MTAGRTGLALRRDGTAPADLYLDTAGNLVMVHDAEAVGQHARQRALTWSGEWFLDEDVGVAWLDTVLGMAYNAGAAEALVKECILDTDGVTGITSFSVSFDRATRGVSIVDADVSTEYDT